jgi:hypothetical protein
MKWTGIPKSWREGNRRDHFAAVVQTADHQIAPFSLAWKALTIWRPCEDRGRRWCVLSQVWYGNLSDSGLWERRNGFLRAAPLDGSTDMHVAFFLKRIYFQYWTSLGEKIYARNGKVTLRRKSSEDLMSDQNRESWRTVHGLSDTALLCLGKHPPKCDGWDHHVTGDESWFFLNIAKKERSPPCQSSHPIGRASHWLSEKRKHGTSYPPKWHLALECRYSRPNARTYPRKWVRLLFGASAAETDLHWISRFNSGVFGLATVLNLHGTSISETLAGVSLRRENVGWSNLPLNFCSSKRTHLFPESRN